jgi:hypothetical protein
VKVWRLLILLLLVVNMKTLITNYLFDAAGRKITFLDYAVLDLTRVLLITNVTTNTIIYNFADPTKGGIAVGNVLTLTYDTSSMLNTHVLQAFLDIDGATLSDLQQQNMYLRRLLVTLQSNTIIDASGRQKINVDAMPSVTIGTNAALAAGTAVYGALSPTVVTPLTGGLFVVPDVWRTIDIARQTFAEGIRRNLTFS